ncbi:unnamed protein product, partial [Iphiclides podalirius]
MQIRDDTNRVTIIKGAKRRRAGWRRRASGAGRARLGVGGGGGGGGGVRRGGRAALSRPSARAQSAAARRHRSAAATAAMEHFIEAVRKYPCLWNTTAIEYRDQELKDAAWTEVMKETDLSSVKEVKLKWKKLRDSYRDALKRQSEMLAKDPSNQAKKNYPWKYMGPMQFLQPHMSVRKKPAEPGSGFAVAADCGAHNGGADARSTDDSDSEAESCAKRKGAERLALIERKLDYLCKAHGKRQFTEAHLQERGRPPPAHTAHAAHPAHPAHPAPAAPDPLDIFFNGMCQSTKRFPYPTQIKIKRTLFDAVIAAEEALIAEQQSYASLWARGGGSSSSSSADADADADADAEAADDERRPA